MQDRSSGLHAAGGKAGREGTSERMGSFGYLGCRVATGGPAVRVRLCSPAADDSLSGPPVNRLSRLGWQRILGGVPYDFLLFGWRKVVGDLNQAGMRIVKIASRSAIFGGRKNSYALGGGK